MTDTQTHTHTVVHLHPNSLPYTQPHTAW